MNVEQWQVIYDSKIKLRMMSASTEMGEIIADIFPLSLKFFNQLAN